LHRLLHFVGSGLIERRATGVLDFDGGAAILGNQVNRVLLAMMPPEPAPVIQSLADGDAVQPSLQRTAAPKAANPAKRLQENILRNIRGVARLLNHSYDEAVNWPRVARDQPVERRAGATLQLRHEFGFVLRPGKDVGQV